jgi:hypothetical protein
MVENLGLWVLFLIDGLGTNITSHELSAAGDCHPQVSHVAF